MKHATTRALFAYWDGLRGERTAPERSEIDPGAIRHVLADTFIVEIDAQRHCPFRLAGTRICALFGRELKGASFRELWAEGRRHEGARLVESVIDEMAGAVAGLDGTTAGDRHLDLELLLLPLRHRGRTHERLLGALSPAAAPALLGIDPLVAMELRSMRIIRPERGVVPVGGQEPAPHGLRTPPRPHPFRVYDGGRSPSSQLPRS